MVSKEDLRIVFLGTPQFAVESLKILVENGYYVVGVVTATDKYGGRGGKQLIQSDVKKYAESQGIKVLQPKNLKAPAFVEELASLKAHLQIVVAFRMLPVVVWDMPPLGTYNLHGSLLPKYRGAAPIHWAVINGEKETGVTSFKLKHQIDTGDIAFQEKMSIGPDENTGSVHDRMMILGAEVVLKTVDAIVDGSISFSPQDDAKVTKAPKIFKETCEIDFSKPAEEVHNFIRGLSPFPGAYTMLNNKMTKILKAKLRKDYVTSGAPGTYFTNNKDQLHIQCQEGMIEVLELKQEGKRQMKIDVFLNGTTL